MSIDERHFTVKEVAARLGVTDRLVRQLITSGELGHARFGRYIRVSESALTDYKQARTTQARKRAA